MRKGFGANRAGRRVYGQAEIRVIAHGRDGLPPRQDFQNRARDAALQWCSGGPFFLRARAVYVVYVLS